MSKYLLGLALLLSLGLAACSGDDTPTNTENDTPAETDTEAEHEEEVSTDENVQESELGKLTIDYKNEELGLSHEAGPMSLTLNAVQVATLEVAEDFKESFDNQDVATVVTINMTAKNSTDQTISFYPDQATLVTDTGQQVEADLWYSGEVGGDFMGAVTMEDDVVWILKHDENIKKLTLHISGPFDEDFETVGEDFTLDVPLE
ncbi:hypothetical protein MTP04_25870 [Lysinibacillus sp. PLM2]|nr:hypothetical protein MTP04_25870 [Lysinibacillus sp. PLM2]